MHELVAQGFLMVIIAQEIWNYEYLFYLQFRGPNIVKLFLTCFIKTLITDQI